MEKIETVRKILKEYNQEHLLVCYEKMSEQEKEQLLDEILNIDFDLILGLFNNRKEEIDLEGE